MVLIVSFSSSDLAADVDGDLAREVAVRDRGRDERDVPHLRRQDEAMR